MKTIKILKIAAWLGTLAIAYYVGKDAGETDQLIENGERIKAETERLIKIFCDDMGDDAQFDIFEF